MSINNDNNPNILQGKNEPNQHQNPSSSIVMKKIVLLEPEIKIKKDDSSMKSLDISNDSN